MVVNGIILLTEDGTLSLDDTYVRPGFTRFILKASGNSISLGFEDASLIKRSFLNPIRQREPHFTFASAGPHTYFEVWTTENEQRIRIELGAHCEVVYEGPFFLPTKEQ